tara:strand:- start:2832 stop:3038 length:207 start_codon:yes stop_codon:yes gene_type:complete
LIIKEFFDIKTDIITFLNLENIILLLLLFLGGGAKSPRYLKPTIIVLRLYIQIKTQFKFVEKVPSNAY